VTIKEKQLFQSTLNRPNKV